MRLSSCPYAGRSWPGRRCPWLSQLTLAEERREETGDMALSSPGRRRTKYGKNYVGRKEEDPTKGCRPGRLTAVCGETHWWRLG